MSRDVADPEYNVTVERIDRRIPDPIETPTITVKRYAQIVGIGLRTAYAGIESGEIPSIKIGSRVVILTRQALARIGLLNTPTAA
jgi:excisionase family DNA binding protein